ncbi:MAG: helix-turn-helix domain-containing protein [Aquificota bacterium]|nr:helix-turn-helix domain-containing protein [Aquificota bacterium]
MSVQTRGRLIEAAKRVFSERGYHNAQIAHIIDEAGVARGTFYLYFRSKEEIFRELLREVVEELKDGGCKVSGPCERTLLEQVVENVREGWGRPALEERELARIVLLRN